MTQTPQLASFARTVATSADAVRKASESVAAAAQDQTALMGALADAAGSLAEEARATAARLETTRETARRAGTDLAASLRIVEDLLHSVLALADLSEGTAAAMDDFGRLMGEIGAMTEFVEEVSDETQLLALNAAIEAARAGQHGLGFAVVAGEVGRLAKTTGESTTAIRDLVARIRTEAETTIATVREAAQRSARSAPSARLAAEILGAVAALARDVAAALDVAAEEGRTHASHAAEVGREMARLATASADQGRRALEAAFSTQRLAYYGSEMLYASRQGRATHNETRTLRCATLLPPGYPPTRAWERFAELVAQRSGGSLKVELEIPFNGTELEALMRVRAGELDFVSVTCYVASSLLPLAQVFDLPFLFADAPSAHRVLDGNLGRYVLQAFEPFGLRGMGYFENGIRHFTNNLRPVSRPEDVRGMRVRIQDSVVYLALMHVLHASPKVIPFDQLRAALERGDVDAQENPLPNILGTKIYEVQRYLTLTAHTYNTQIVLANCGTLDRLAPDEREMVESALREVIPWHRTISAEDDQRALAELRGLMEVRELDHQERAAFVGSATFVWERIGRIFPDAVTDLLLGGDLSDFAPPAAGQGAHGHHLFQMQDIVDAIDDAVGALRSSAGEGAGQAREQAPTLRHLAETARMMSEESGTLAERFTGLLTRFATAQDDVERTRETVRELATAVRELADTAQESRAALERFAGLMERIGEIVALVRQVSDRTNLLALNAAIEAARAGEHGKGFDVVASEVRRLAERTRASTQQMRSVLGDLGARGGSASQAISAGVVQAERSARQAAAAEEALARIDEFTGGVIETLAEAQREATSESQRAFAMRGDFDEMAALTEYHSEQSLRSVESTQALERERRALFAEGAPAAPANGALQPHLSPGENR